MPSLQRISDERLAQAEFGSASTSSKSKSGGSDTVLYLAFGSNLNWKIITEQKGTKPLGKVNVTAPSLRLVFDLPGIPYLEPCFANTAFREIPKDPFPVPINPGPSLPPIDDGKKPKWTNGLVGTVYEVTREDYAKIMAKEGGGSGYVEILVPCLALPPSVSVPERPNPTVPRPFIARTLYQPDIPNEAPEVPDLPDIPEVPKPGKPDQGHHDADKEPKDGTVVNLKQKDAESPSDPDPSNPPKKSWWTKLWLRMVTPHKRPNPEYAQASARYLNLIVQGGRENELPTEYQEYLEALEPYTITTFRQRIGRLVTIVTLLPAVMVMFTVSGVVADKEGRYPPWMTTIFHLGFKSIWVVYDFIMKPLFGDGERTISAESTKEPVYIEEKLAAKSHIIDETVPLLA